MANVEIYTKETCPYCHRAKALLSSKGVSFQELPIDGNAAKREEMIKRSGRTTVPQIIDAQHIGGCDDLYAFGCTWWTGSPAEITCERWHYIAQYLRTTLKGFLHMSEQNNTEMTFQIQRIYTKDISFEAPNAPHVFQKDWQPEVKLDLDTASTQLADDVYEVVLRVTVTASLGEETAFLCEVQQAAFLPLRVSKAPRWHIAWATSARTFCSRMLVSASPAWYPAVHSQPTLRRLTSMRCS